MLENDRIKIQSAILMAAVALCAFFATAACKRAHVPKCAAVTVEVKGEGVSNPGIYVVEETGATFASALSRAGCRPGIQEVFAHRLLVSGQALEMERGKTGFGIKIGRMEARALLACGLKLDLNSASLEDLLLVPHLRPSVASAIVRRRGRKPWGSLDDLTEIRGVGEKSVQTLRDYLEVSAGSSPAPEENPEK